MRRYVVLFVLLLLPVAFAQQELMGIVLGDELGWEIPEIEVLLSVGKDGPVTLEVYSPGFDPDDYRAALDGHAEVGDERYDRNEDELLGEFFLEKDGQIIASGAYQVEPHRWDVLFDGNLAAGGYTIRTRFSGRAKNAFIYRVSTPDAASASLAFANGLKLFDVHGNDWVKGFEMTVPAEALPVKYALYDGDGASELEVRARMPDGRDETLEVSESLMWQTWTFTEPGHYDIYFRIPDTATQYSNTVALKEVFPDPVQVEIVDTDGTPLDIPYSVKGYSDRTVDISVPETYTLVDVQTEGRLLTTTQVGFGFSGGHVRYVLKKQPDTATLTLRAQLVTPEEERPYALSLGINDDLIEIPASGELTLNVPAGEYRFAPRVLNARAEGPTSLNLQAGEHKDATFTITPDVRLELTLEPEDVTVGEHVTITATASTDFADLLPADVSLALPESLRVTQVPRITAPMSDTRVVVLTVEAVATQAGVVEVGALLAPWELQETATVVVREPARLVFEKTVTPQRTVVGDTVVFALTVTNTGGVTTDVVLEDVLPAGLQGVNVTERFDLAAGETREFHVTAQVDENATGTLTNEAVVRWQDEQQTARASVEVLRPEASLSRTLDKHHVLPGERVTVGLTVMNTGQDTLTYDLQDSLPEWLQTSQTPAFTGTLEPGASRTHTYEATVMFGGNASSHFNAVLRSNAGRLQAKDGIHRVTVLLEKTVTPSVITEGTSAQFTVRLQNPLARAITLELRESPANGLGLDAPNVQSLDLAPSEAREFVFDALPVRTGVLDNEVSVFMNGTPVAFPARAELTVKPPLRAERISTVSVPFFVDATAEQLLIRHELPLHSQYEPNSSRVDGVPVAEPRLQRLMSEDGTERVFLVWQLAFVPEGTLSYTLLHSDALPALAQPDLTVRAGAHEVFIQGEASFELLDETTPLKVQERNGLIREPQPQQVFRTVDQTKIVIETPLGAQVDVRVNDAPLSDNNLGKAEYDDTTNTQRFEYYGIALLSGRNVIHVNAAGQQDQLEVFLADNPVQLVIQPVRLQADGVTPLVFEVRALDANALSNGFGAVSLASNLEFLEADAFPDKSGYQLLLKDGVARVTLAAIPVAQEVRLSALFNDLRVDDTFFVGGGATRLYQYQGSVTARLQEGRVRFEGLARAYAETPFADGTLQVAVDTHGGLAQHEDPTGHFPLTGSSAEAQAALYSEDFVAFRYDDPTFSVGYFAQPLDVPAITGLANATALRAEARVGVSEQQDLKAAAFAGVFAKEHLYEEITPDGTRLYYLGETIGRRGEAIKMHSEDIVIQVGATETRLERLKDYVINYSTGTLTLAFPLYPTDAAYPNQPVRLIARYIPETATRTSFAYGAGAHYQSQNWQFGVGLAHYDGLNAGAFIAYEHTDFSVRADYRYDPQNGSKISLNSNFKQNALSGQTNLSYQQDLTGQARVAYNLTDKQAIALEHNASSKRNDSSVLYELQVDALTFGVGAGYFWEASTVSAVTRAGYKTQDFAVTLTHTQPLKRDTQSVTDARGSYQLDENLAFDFGLAYTWGNELNGTFGLTQTLGSSNLSLSYQLPTVSGQGNRARFGIETPFVLNDDWSLNVSANYERAFTSGRTQVQSSAGVRYEQEAFNATFAADVNHENRDETPFKVVFRSGVSGQLDHQQSLAFDANIQVIPELDGDFTLSYALRADRYSVLSYHRLSTGQTNKLEGEVAPTLHFGTRWQLRPGFAYLLALDDAHTDTYLLSLGGHYYVTNTIGIGGALHQQWQPHISSNTALSLEGSTRVIDDIWVVLGYTLNGFDGLKDDTRQGVYVRLELFGGN